MGVASKSQDVIVPEETQHARAIWSCYGTEGIWFPGSGDDER